MTSSYRLRLSQQIFLIFLLLLHCVVFLISVSLWPSLGEDEYANSHPSAFLLPPEKFGTSISARVDVTNGSSGSIGESLQVSATLGIGNDGGVDSEDATSLEKSSAAIVSDAVTTLPLKMASTFASSPAARRSLSERRFPVYGTEEFRRVCGYTDRAGTFQGMKCVLYATVSVKSNEGVSAWASSVAALMLYAAQSRCGIKVDYGANVSLTDLLSPVPLPERLVSSPEVTINETVPKFLNWTVPPDFVCSKRCAAVAEGFMSKDKKRESAEHHLLRGKKNERPLVAVPMYRFAYNGGTHVVRRRDFENVTELLPGFEIETGMACAWNRLFQLAPTAAKYRPNLFTQIWPALHDEESFVIALYMRTRNADRTAKQVGSGKEVTPDSTPWRVGYEKVVNCSAELEEKYLMAQGAFAGREGVPAYPRVVWLVVTDSPNVAQYVAANYDTASGNRTNNATSVVPRSVVTTSSVGAHSKPRNNPNTAVFSDAFIDWYLIGESDVVISHGALSFGSTAALRTARPVYDTGCNLMTLVHDD